MDDSTAQESDSLSCAHTTSVYVRADTALQQVAIRFAYDGVFDEFYMDRVEVQSLVVQLERAQLELDAPVPAPVLGGVRDLATDLFETASFAANMGLAFAFKFVTSAIK